MKTAILILIMVACSFGQQINGGGGSGGGGGGTVTGVTATAPIVSSGGTAPVISGTYEGNGSKIQLFTGSDPATNDCAKFDPSHNIVTTGAPCGSSGGPNVTISHTFSGTQEIAYTHNLNTLSPVLSCFDHTTGLGLTVGVNVTTPPTVNITNITATNETVDCSFNNSGAVGATGPVGPPGSAGVTSISTTSPITGGTITSTGTIACATCGVTGSPLSQFSATTSSQLAGVLSDETGTGVAVFGTSPTFTAGITDPLIKPPSDSTTAIRLTKADGTTTMLTLDTTNTRVLVADTLEFASSIGGNEAGISAAGGAGTIQFLIQGGVGEYADFNNHTVTRDKVIGWSTQFTANTVKTAGIARNADNVVEINNGTLNSIADLKLRHTIGGGTAPTITGGFGTSPSIAGFDGGGRLTVGTGGTATTGVITFGTAYTTAPACSANNETTISTVQAAATTTTLTLNTTVAFSAGAKLTWTCNGY